MEENTNEVIKEKTINLGEKIRISGFQSEEGSTMVIVKKMVGNYVKSIMDNHEEFQDITINLKKIHQHEEKGESKGGKNEVHVKVNSGKIFTSEVTDFNLFVAIDKVFKKIISEME